MALPDLAYRAFGWFSTTRFDRFLHPFLAGNEYEAAFERAATSYPGYRLYRGHARHHIPIFRLEPAPRAASS